ncbi:MAG: ribonuclease [Clostridia bacterium]|nr:RNAse [Clostridiales bacterium]MDK2985879.1 ribonuclease [Clostridia bacterium]
MNKQEILNYMRESTYKPLTSEELVSELQIEDITSFLEKLREMERNGDVIVTRKNKYGIPERMGLLVGYLQAHQKGYAFLIPERKPERYEGGDVYISAANTNGAMHNDRVIVRLLGKLSGSQKPEGEVIRILKRSNTTVVGTLERSRNFGFVIPDDSRMYYDIFIPSEEMGGAQTGDKVVVKITTWPESRRSPEGKIIEILGAKGEKGVDVLSIVRKYELPEEFPADVLQEAEKVAKIPEGELSNRRDLRDIRMVTIDGEDAKDLDDAVSISRLQNGNYHLGVHIADVGYYVKHGTKLDQEAFERGTSVYLVDRVIPMLPPELSNGICSLNAGEIRLAMSVLMEVDHQGNVKEYEITPSVINIDRRLTYSTVNKILLNNDEELKKEYANFLDDFYLMQELCGILKKKRLKRGSIDFEFPESKVKLDEEGKPVEIVKVERGIAERIIEEFMILANETVAEHMYWLEIPFVYRVHEEPEPDDMEALNNFLHTFGYHIRATDDGVHPASFREIIEKVKGQPEEKVINTVMLRSMKHARYSNQALGHFGLASTYYSHFTSPIRRYPDLVIHRIIRETLKKGSLGPKRIEQLQQFTAEASEQSSIREKVAEEAERESLDLKKVEYMERHLGEIFEGIISSVTSFGFFVELENTVEGLVHVSTLTDDFYHFDEKNLALYGEHTGKIFKIGKPVKVQVAKVNTEQRQIDFELIEFQQ